MPRMTCTDWAILDGIGLAFDVSMVVAAAWWIDWRRRKDIKRFFQTVDKLDTDAIKAMAATLVAQKKDLRDAQVRLDEIARELGKHAPPDSRASPHSDREP